MSPAAEGGWPTSIALIGAGKMGAAMVRCWLAAGLDPTALCIVDPGLTVDAQADWQAAGVRVDRPAIPPDVLVLAVKPQVLSADPAAFAPFASSATLVISIMAGQTIRDLRAALPAAGAIVRAMPNQPAAIGRGATGVAAERRIDPSRRVLVQRLLGATGLVEWLDESLIDAVTAVSGSGPAYVYLLAECLAEAGEAAGLPPDVAGRLARATVEGAGALMARETARSPAQLREAVTSPNGTTAAALAVLRDPAAMPALLREAVAAAARRAGELAG